MFSSLTKLVSAIRGPKYDGKFLHSKVKQLLTETKLSETLTNVIIPTFDIKLLQPVIFSSFEVLLSLSLSVESKKELQA